MVCFWGKVLMDLDARRMSRRRKVPSLELCCCFCGQMPFSDLFALRGTGGLQ